MKIIAALKKLLGVHPHPKEIKARIVTPQRYIKKGMTITEAARITLTNDTNKSWSTRELFDHLVKHGISIKNVDVLRATLNKDTRNHDIIHRATPSGRWYGTYQI